MSEDWREDFPEYDEYELDALEIAAEMTTRQFNRVMRVVESLRNGELYPGESKERAEGER